MHWLSWAAPSVRSFGLVPHRDCGVLRVKFEKMRLNVPAGVAVVAGSAFENVAKKAAAATVIEVMGYMAVEVSS